MNKFSEPFKGGMLAGVMSAIVSGLLNYYLLPIPSTPLDNMIGHGIGGFFTGFISAFIGVFIYIQTHRSSKCIVDGGGIEK